MYPNATFLLLAYDQSTDGTGSQLAHGLVRVHERLPADSSGSVWSGPRAFTTQFPLPTILHACKSLFNTCYPRAGAICRVFDGTQSTTIAWRYPNAGQIIWATLLSSSTWAHARDKWVQPPQTSGPIGHYVTIHLYK